MYGILIQSHEKPVHKVDNTYLPSVDIPKGVFFVMYDTFATTYKGKFE